MQNNHINYIELYATDMETTKKFYSSVFGWKFTDYGETYSAFSSAGVDGGFEKADQVKRGGPLVILYHAELEKAQEKVAEGGGKISKEIFSFPGGRRFHFYDPNGNELAIWSDK